MKRYKEFIKLINEDKKSKSDIIELRDDFNECVYSMFINNFQASYSMLSRKEKIGNDFEEMQKSMDDMTWNFEKISDVFSKENDDLLGGENLIDSYNRYLDDYSGYVDFYIYRLAEKLGLDNSKIYLGGDGWGEQNWDPEEAMIRYKYGYHTTEYGKLLMKQIGMSDSDMSIIISGQIYEDLSEELDGILITLLKTNKDYLNVRLNSLDYYSTIDDDRIIIDIGLMEKDLGDDSINAEMIIKKIMDYYNGLDIFQVIGDELIIWLKK